MTKAQQSAAVAQQQQHLQDGATGSAGSSAAGPGSSSGGHVVTGPPRRVSAQEVQMVQNLIERCMQQYIPQAQVVSLLHQQAKIEPSFTTLVWQKLEEQNPNFFKLYYVRLKLKEQIVMFNYLLEQQVSMVQKLYAAWLQALPSMMPPPGGMRPPVPGMPPMMPGMPFPFPGMPGMPPGMMPPAGAPGAMPVAAGGAPAAPAAAGAAGASSAAPSAAAAAGAPVPAGVPAPTQGAGPSSSAPAAVPPPGMMGMPAGAMPLPSSMDGLDLLEGALEATGNLDLSMLHLHAGNMDDLMEGISLDGTAGGETHGGAGGALGLDLQIPKNLSFGDLGAFDFNLGPGLDHPMDFTMPATKGEVKQEHHVDGMGLQPADGLGLQSTISPEGLHDHPLGRDALAGLGAGGLHDDHGLGNPHHDHASGTDAFGVGMGDMDMSMGGMGGMGMGLGGQGQDLHGAFKRNFSLGDMAGLEPPSGPVNLGDGPNALDFDVLGKS